MYGFESAYESYQSGKLDCSEAGMLLGMSERTFRRWKSRYECEGAEGLQDKRVGRVSPHRAQDSEVKQVIRLYAERYRGFNVRHYHHFLVEHHGLCRSYSFVKRALEAAQLITPGKRGGDHRLRRKRKPMEGLMLHQDASTHRWFGDATCDLVVTLDDATSEITSAFFCEQEGTLSSMRGARETVERKGLFCSLYTDRGSAYWLTTEAGGKVDKTRLTEFGRALQQLGIKHIAAYSPQARGRSERMFGTLQDRLVGELALAGITTMNAANAYLTEKYLPAHNRQFTVTPENEHSAYLPYAGRPLADILCIQENRIVANDNTVRYNNLTLQIPKDDNRHHYVKCEVTVHHYPDSSLAIFYGPRRLATYAKNGTIIKEKTMKNAA
jgi:transposase